MSRTDFGQMHCSIARSLDILGESWTPLILRDLLLGFTQYEEIREDLGISTNILSDRLASLVENGVVERRPYGNHPNRFDYRLTPKGEDAIPIILAMVAWGDRWEAGQPGPPTHVVHQSCGRTTRATIHCSECGERLRLDDLTYHRGPGSRRGVGTELLQTHLEPAWESTG
jgi:DNA-binding HxlR family transcriptional regulator